MYVHMCVCVCVSGTALFNLRAPIWAVAVAGFGSHLARPLFRERHRADMSEEEATQLLHDALKV